MLSMFQRFGDVGELVKYNTAHTVYAVSVLSFDAEVYRERVSLVEVEL